MGISTAWTSITFLPIFSMVVKAVNQQKKPQRMMPIRAWTTATRFLFFSLRC